MMIPCRLYFFDVGTSTEPIPQSRRPTSPKKDVEIKPVNNPSSQMGTSLSFIQPMKNNGKIVVTTGENDIKI